MMSRADNRRSQRIRTFVSPCHVFDGDRPIPGFLTDLSVDGGRVSCEGDPPLVRAAVILEVRIGRHVHNSRIPAVVAWVREVFDRGYEFGLTFQGMLEEDREALLALLADFRRRAALLG
jgi:hypothetical protein